MKFGERSGVRISRHVSGWESTNSRETANYVEEDMGQRERQNVAAT